MPFTLTMPKLSPTMEEGSIAKWHKNEGDKVNVGDLLAEIATDKATVEYNALDEGYLRKILVATGGHAVVNQPIAIFTISLDESIEGYQPTGIAPVQQEQTPKSQETVKPEESQPQAPVSFQQPKFSPEPPLEGYDFKFPTSSVAERIAASPLAKKLAKEKGLDLSSVQGSGPRGRISSRDLNLAQPDLPVNFNKRAKPTIAPGSYEEVALTPMRKAIAQKLQQAKTFIPHVYVRQEIDAAPLVELRDQLKSADVKVTFNDFVVRACALALREHPNINSGFDSATQSIVLFQTIDISLAVNLEGGLITPIVRHADYKNLGEISVEVKDLAARARSNKLKPEEYKGGSFTISNLGMFGVSDFAAIINPPQAAILAVGGIEECVRVKNGEIKPGKKMNLVLSVDHRVIDGAEAAKFIKSVQKYLELPVLLLV
jgi:pyruvate dehydrogenase E2 component (dihydrolipoamide acetyltransferase)